MGKKESIHSYEARIQTHLQSLKNLGRAVPHKEAVRIVIANLPDKYWVHVWRRDMTENQNGQQCTTDGFLFGQSLRYVFEELKLVELAYQRKMFITLLLDLNSKILMIQIQRVRDPREVTMR